MIKRIGTKTDNTRNIRIIIAGVLGTLAFTQATEGNIGLRITAWNTLEAWVSRGRIGVCMYGNEPDTKYGLQINQDGNITFGDYESASSCGNPFFNEESQASTGKEN